MNGSRGYIGIQMQTVPGGVKVMHVVPNAPADRAGLKTNDIVYEALGRPITNHQVLQGIIQSHKVGDAVLFKVKRGEEKLELKVLVAPVAPSSTYVRVYLIGNHLVQLMGPAQDNAPAPETAAFFNSLKLGGDEQIAAADAKRPLHEVGKGLELHGKLAGSKLNLVYRVKLAAGTTYTIDMVAPNQPALDPYLVLTDAAGKRLAEDDDSGGGLNARIVFRPEQAGTFRIVATSFNNGTGDFTLTVRDAAKAAAAKTNLANAQAHAARGDWKAAAAEYAQALAAQPLDDGERGFEHAAVLLLSGDQAGYRNRCAELLAKSGQVDFRPYHAARACTLAPDAVKDAALPGKKAAGELQRNATKHWSLNQRGALAYRAGRYDQARALLQKSLAANPRVGAAVVTWAWLALVEHRRGNAAEARTWLAKATKGLEEYSAGVAVLGDNAKNLHLHNWLEAQCLRREAEALLAPKQKTLPSGGL